MNLANCRKPPGKCIDISRYSWYIDAYENTTSQSARPRLLRRGPLDRTLLSRLEEAEKLFKALADETRLSILRQLREQGEVCACDFRACCDVAQPTVSHHLKVLREAGLVESEKRGLWVHYRLNAAKLDRLRALLP